MEQKIKQYVRSKYFTLALVGVAAIAGGLAIFQLGIAVGYHKAHFGITADREYGEVFDKHRPPLFGAPGDHGAAGTIVSVSLPNLTVADVSGVEKTIAIDDDTIIREFQDSFDQNNLANGMHVVIFGDPDDNTVITAKFIRVIPTDTGIGQPQ